MTKRLEIKPGYVVISTTTATGGITYTRDHGTVEAEGMGGIRQDIASVKRIDHVEAVKATRAVAGKAERAVARRCTRVAGGWYHATSEALAVLSMDLADLAPEVDAANALAESVGSAARAHVGVMPVQLDVSNAECVREIYRTIRESLTEIHGAIVAGDAHDLGLALTRAVRLDSLAVGLAGDAIRMALEAAKSAGSEIRAVNRRRDDGIAVETVAEVAQRMTETYSGAVETALAWVSDTGIGQ